MSKNDVANFTRGTLTGMVAGAALVTVGKMMLKNNRNLSRGSDKAMKAVGDFVDGIQTMFH